MEKKLNYSRKEDILCLELEGDYIEYTNETSATDLFKKAQDDTIKGLRVSAKDLGQWDSSLVIILFQLEKISRQKKILLEYIALPQGLKQLIELAFSVDRKPVSASDEQVGFLETVGNWGIDSVKGINKGFAFFNKSLASIMRFVSGKAIMRKVDLLFALEDCSYKALPIVTLISFMVGLILAFVGAVQLKTFGAEIYVASLVTIGMTRIMGAIMTGIIMAGRTGASYAATIGTMQVNEEIDALKTMGIAPIDFLVLPRMIALVLTMPILTMWSDFMGMLGGGFVGVTMLGIPFQKYVEMSIEAIALNNFLVGIFHGFVFGIVIALSGCYYGVNCGRNADSVGVATTKSVVSAIVGMILMTGVITVACEVLEI